MNVHFIQLVDEVETLIIAKARWKSAHNALHCQVGLASGRSLGIGTGDVVVVVLAHAGQTNSATTLDLFLPTSGDRQAILRGHGGATRQPELATRWRQRRRRRWKWPWLAENLGLHLVVHQTNGLYLAHNLNPSPFVCSSVSQIVW